MEVRSRSARTAAVLAWVTAAAFGLPAVPVAVHLTRTGSLPVLLDLYPMYGGPWFERLPPQAVAQLLGAYLAVNAGVAVAAWSVWRGSRRGRVAAAVLMPVEAVFWVGFALPIPWVLGAARAVALARAATDHRRATRTRPT